MRDIVRPAVAALAVVGLALSAATLSGGDAFAQAKQAPAQAAPPADAPMKQMPLTEKQIQGVLAAQKDMDALDDKLPDNPNVKPDPKVTAQLEAIAKKNGFASYAEYNNVMDNISLVLGGFDPATKKYVGAEAVLKQQIAAVQADNKMPSKDKKQALDEMNAALKTPAPATRFESHAVVSAAGDLAATWGGSPGGASWLRVWRRAGVGDPPGLGWRLVADMSDVVPLPEPDQ